MRLSKLSKSDQKLITKGLKSKDAFVRNLAENVEKADKMSDKQRNILLNSSVPSYKRLPNHYVDYDLAEQAVEDNQIADAMGGSPWGED